MEVVTTGGSHDRRAPLRSALRGLPAEQYAAWSTYSMPLFVMVIRASNISTVIDY